MSDGAFLEKARSVKPIEPEPSDNGEAIYLALRCWPELLAVVEAARESQSGDLAWKYQNITLSEALEALDDKAGSLDDRLESRKEQTRTSSPSGGTTTWQCDECLTYDCNSKNPCSECAYGGCYTVGEF